eukprot:TCONS_00004026-protein
MFLFLLVVNVLQFCGCELLEPKNVKRKVNLKDISKLVPLNFVADTAGIGDFDPEKNGLLIHEYFDQLYKKYPQYKKFSELQDEQILMVDPFKDKNNPYADAVKKFKWVLESIYQDNGGKLDSEKSGNNDARFQLDSAEVAEYERPTVPPLSEIQTPADVDDSDNLYDGDNIQLDIDGDDDGDNLNEFK